MRGEQNLLGVACGVDTTARAVSSSVRVGQQWVSAQGGEAQGPTLLGACLWKSGEGWGEESPEAFLNSLKPLNHQNPLKSMLITGTLWNNFFQLWCPTSLAAGPAIPLKVGFLIPQKYFKNHFLPLQYNTGRTIPLFGLFRSLYLQSCEHKLLLSRITKINCTSLLSSHFPSLWLQVSKAEEIFNDQTY